MIKRSAATLMALLATVANARHVHGPNHSSHVKAPSAAQISEIKVQGEVIPDVNNEEICSFYKDDSFYVLKFLISREENYKATADGRTIEFNICNRLNGYNTTGDACYQSFACLTDSDGGKYPLSSHDFGSTFVPLVELNRENDTNRGGLSLIYEGSDSPCEANPQHKKSLKLDLLCGDDSGVEELKLHNYNFQTCQVEVQLKSKQACYVFTLGPFFRYIDKYYYLFGLGMIMMGLFVGFLGRKLIHPTICVVGTLLFVGASSWLIFTLAFDRDSEEVTQWIVFGICCLVGIFVGILLAWLAKYTAAGLSAYGAVCLGLILYTSFLYKYDNEKQILFYLFLVFMGVLGGVLGFVMYNHALIVSTSIIGGYLVIRGISLYAGGFPNEMLIIEQIKNGQVSQFPGAFWGYFAGFILLTIGMIFSQYKMFSKMSDKEKHPYHRLR